MVRYCMPSTSADNAVCLMQISAKLANKNSQFRRNTANKQKARGARGAVQSTGAFEDISLPQVTRSGHMQEHSLDQDSSRVYAYTNTLQTVQSSMPDPANGTSSMLPGELLCCPLCVAKFCVAKLQDAMLSPPCVTDCH